MKTCAKCKNEFQIGMFAVHKREKDGHDCYCRTCKSEIDKKYRKNNKEKVKNKAHEKYVRNMEHIKNKSSLYAKSNRNKNNASSTKSRLKLKTKVFVHYCGGKIQCKCGVNDLYLLTIDHINGGGNEHRKQIGRKTGYNFYRWLKNNNYPDGFQVLCFNCQYRKRLVEMRSDNPTLFQKYQANYVQSIKA